MIEVNIDASEVKRLADLLEQSPAVIEAAKREAIAAAAPKMKAIVDQEIGGSGRVKSWQGQYVGSGGLYAAVRPKKETYVETKGKQKGWRAGPKKYAVGYITNAINNGHRTPRNKWGYRTSGKTIKGKEFYQRASTRLGQVAEEASENIGKALVTHLTGTKAATAPQATPNAGDFQQFTRNIGGKTYTFKHV